MKCFLLHQDKALAALRPKSTSPGIVAAEARRWPAQLIYRSSQGFPSGRAELARLLLRLKKGQPHPRGGMIGAVLVYVVDITLQPSTRDVSREVTKN